MNMYTLESLKEINNRFCRSHEMTEYDVEKANEYVELIENSRSKLESKIGDMIQYTNEYGEYFEKAHIDEIYEDGELYICERPYVPFVGVNENNNGISCSTSGGAWEYLSKEKLTYVGKSKKRFCVWGNCGACADGAVEFEAEVNVWSYTSSENKFISKISGRPYTTKEFDRMIIHYYTDKYGHSKDGSGYIYFGSLNKGAWKSDKELLAPYDENIVYAPYVLYTREQAIAKIRKEIEDYKNGPYTEYVSSPKKYEESHPNAEHINYLKNKFPKKLEWTDDECYEDMKGRFDEDMIKLNGDLLSTYNPNSKWDWYTIGGRWNNYLKTLSGETTNEDYASEIDWKDIIPFAFVTPIGEWHERGEMGWWACVSNGKNIEDWKSEFKEFLDNLDEDTIVTVVDCHI